MEVGIGLFHHPSTYFLTHPWIVLNTSSPRILYPHINQRSHTLITNTLSPPTLAGFTISLRTFLSHLGYVLTLSFASSEGCLSPIHLLFYLSSNLPTHPSTHVPPCSLPTPRYFTKAHNLPQEFDFANYVNRLFMKFIAELGDVSPLSWLLLACLVVVNFLRAAAIDPR